MAPAAATPNPSPRSDSTMPGNPVLNPRPARDCLLLDPAVRCDGKLRRQGQANVSLQGQANLASLYTNLSKTARPYLEGGPPIELVQEIVSTHEDKVVFAQRSDHGGIATTFFVYSFKEGTMVEVPTKNVRPQILLPQSMGVMSLRNGESCLLAHLRVTADPAARLLKGSLHRWIRTSGPAQWTQDQEPVQVIIPFEGNVRKWHTDRVIPGMGLLWVDLNHGFILLHPCLDRVQFDFVRLPQELTPKPQELTTNNPPRKVRPELSRSIGFCNRTIKLVDLHHYSSCGNDKIMDTVDVHIWSLAELDTYGQNGEKWDCNWEKENTVVTLHLPRLWGEFKRTHRQSLPPWPNSLACCPLLSMDTSSILYLTVTEKNDEYAWLLEIDMGIKRLMDVVDYPSFCDHMSPPFPSNLSKYYARRMITHRF